MKGKPKGKSTSKKRSDPNGHQVRLGNLAYARLRELYADFVHKVKSRPELYPAYADRQITMSDVVSIICEEAICRLQENAM